MKIIFLDIDGVLTSARTGWMNWDIYATTFLKWVCLNADVKIVISSTWRCHRDKQFFEDIFGKEIIHADWKTPWDLMNRNVRCRGHEIKLWLEQHPEIDKYLIIDDDSDMLHEQLPNLLLTNTYNGLQFEDMEKIREFFNLTNEPCNMNLQTIIQHSNMFAK